MRIAIISDIHGNLPALEAVAKDILRHDVTTVFNLGDSLSGPLLPRETAQFLMTQNWIHLAGNHERQLLTQNPLTWGESDAYTHAQLTQTEFEWISALKPSLEYNSEILLCHGTPTSDIEYLLETVTSTQRRLATQHEIELRLGTPTATLIACGHTHIPRSVQVGAYQIINPGSVGLPAYSDHFPYPHVMETGSPDARYALIEKKADRWHCALVSVPYAYHLSVNLAKIRKRLDWAHALATGYV